MSEEIDFFNMAEILPKATNAEQLERSPVDGPIVPSHLEKVPSPLDIEAAQKALETPVMQELLSRAEQFTVGDANDASEALTMQDQALTFSKQIEQTRKDIVRPHLDFQKAVKKFSDDLRGQFDAIRDVIQLKLDSYLSEGSEVTGVRAKIENDDASAKEVVEWTFAIQSMDELPDEYITKSINHSAIKAAIKDGVREIPGVRIFSETKTKYRSKPKKKEKTQ